VSCILNERNYKLVLVPRIHVVSLIMLADMYIIIVFTERHLIV